ncbi:hypothetical protein M427DRAFT_155918, partial [Gonapodya prolifera JEL478]
PYFFWVRTDCDIHTSLRHFTKARNCSCKYDPLIPRCSTCSSSSSYTSFHTVRTKIPTSPDHSLPSAPHSGSTAARNPAPLSPTVSRSTEPSRNQVAHASSNTCLATRGPTRYCRDPRSETRSISTAITARTCAGVNHTPWLSAAAQSSSSCSSSETVAAPGC